MASILVVDDDAVFRKLVIASLRSRGHFVVETRSGREADLAIAGARPDLVVVDGLLPDTNGFQWIARQRAQGLCAPIIFASGFWKGAKEAQQPGGANVFLTKPVAPARLLKEVDRLLGAQAEPLVDESDGLSAEQKRELAAMQEQFARDLPERIAGLLTALRQLEANLTSGAVLGVARRRAHNLAGAAGSFGLPQVGAVCAAIEAGLVALPEGGPWEAIAEQVRVLARVSPPVQA